MRIPIALTMRIVFVALVAAQAPIPRYEVKRATMPITIDGKPDEAA